MLGLFDITKPGVTSPLTCDVLLFIAIFVCILADHCFNSFHTHCIWHARQENNGDRVRFQTGVLVDLNQRLTHPSQRGEQTWAWRAPPNTQLPTTDLSHVLVMAGFLLQWLASLLKVQTKWRLLSSRTTQMTHGSLPSLHPCSAATQAFSNSSF